MLIDSFLFFNETELVELRIKYLNNIVDYFVIVEADITHQGKKKDRNFPKIL
jgi:beta-1,4-mannosyl-glycoprotein beta-1,4-N-acetylglucosaminyltransferase